MKHVFALQPPLMQTAPEPQLVPFATAGCVQLPEPSQTSLVQALPSLVHAVPEAELTIEQLVPLHVELDWQTAGEHENDVPPQTPFVHTSLEVHALPSLQVVPFVLFANEQVPSPLHVPAWWHWSGAAHEYAVPAHVPLVHTSLSVHALPSLQAVAFVLFVNALVDVVGVHCWHWLPGFWAPEV
jgi:hypothetical protein